MPAAARGSPRARVPRGAGRPSATSARGLRPAAALEERVAHQAAVRERRDPRLATRSTQLAWRCARPRRARPRGPSRSAAHERRGGRAARPRTSSRRKPASATSSARAASWWTSAMVGCAACARGARRAAPRAAPGPRSTCRRRASARARRGTARGHRSAMPERAIVPRRRSSGVATDPGSRLEPPRRAGHEGEQSVEPDQRHQPRRSPHAAHIGAPRDAARSVRDPDIRRRPTTPSPRCAAAAITPERWRSEHSADARDLAHHAEEIASRPSGPRGRAACPTHGTSRR